MFSCDYCEIFKDIYFEEQLKTAALIYATTFIDNPWKRTPIVWVRQTRLIGTGFAQVRLSELVWKVKYLQKDKIVFVKEYYIRKDNIIFVTIALYCKDSIIFVIIEL